MCNSPVEFSGLVSNQPGRRGKTKIIPDMLSERLGHLSGHRLGLADRRNIRQRVLEACAG
jgi:hypothetical protein